MDSQAHEIVPGGVAPEQEAARLRDRLADLEAEHATLQAELTAFHADYLRQVGVVTAELHELEARYFAAVADQSGAPDDRQAADAAEARARETTTALRSIPKPGPPPTEDLKKLFRDAAKRMHPDLVRDEAGRRHAEAFMKRLNQGYRNGDGQAIRNLLRQWESSPYAAPPADGVAAAVQLEALRAAVASAERRLEDVRRTELARLMEQAMAAEAAGRDFFAELRVTAEAGLRDLRVRLAALGRAG